MKHFKDIDEVAATEATIRIAKIISMLDNLTGKKESRTPEKSRQSILYWYGCNDDAEFNALMRTEGGVKRVLLNFARNMVAELGKDGDK